MKPLIGVTCSFDREKGRVWICQEYLEAVRAAGGIPLPLAHTGDDGELTWITGAVGGLVLSGGGDVDPAFFGEEPMPAGGEICPERDVFEIALSRAALASDIPLLGICRGVQVMNIAAGGDIYQDIGVQHPGGLQIKHYQEAPRWHPTHGITVRAGTVLASILGEGPLRVNSYHHQAVRKVAPGFIVSARSDDGLIEAVERPGRLFALGVQCHPETLWRAHPVFLKLFISLVEAAKIRISERQSAN